MRMLNILGKSFLFFTVVALLFTACKEEKEEPWVNPCSFLVCEHGTLVLSADSTECTCVCDTGYYGFDCSNENYCITQNVVCLNGGVCDSLTGNCVCALGYEGDSCQTLINAKFIDLWEVNEDCTTNGATTSKTYMSSINPGAAGNRIFISNISSSGLTIQATINTSTFIDISAQTVGTLNITTGDGNLNLNTDVITLNYEYSQGGTDYSCTASFMRQ